MKRLINDGDIFDKYASLEEKSLKNHPEEKLGGFNWYGMRHISGTYSGAAYSTSSADGYMATDLRSAANPRGSILKEAKNYVDGKVKFLYNHFITLQGTSGHVYVNYISEYASQYTIATLKNALIGKTLVCSGYLNGSVAEYITSEGGNLSVGVVDVSDGSTTGEIIDDTFSITDEVTPI